MSTGRKKRSVNDHVDYVADFGRQAWEILTVHMAKEKESRIGLDFIMKVCICMTQDVIEYIKQTGENDARESMMRRCNRTMEIDGPIKGTP